MGQWVVQRWHRSAHDRRRLCIYWAGVTDRHYKRVEARVRERKREQRQSERESERESEGESERERERESERESKRERERERERERKRHVVGVCGCVRVKMMLLAREKESTRARARD